MAELPWSSDARQRRNFERFKLWAALNCQQKTQIVSDLKWADPGEPYWRVALPTDPCFPEIVLRAPTGEIAAERYRVLCGVIGWGKYQPAFAAYDQAEGVSA
jgi:hypothetical protein